MVATEPVATKTASMVDARAYSFERATWTRAAIEADQLTCVFGDRRALDGLTLRVPEGGVFGVVGPNGAGKTTLLDVMCGLVRPTSGSVRVLGEEIGKRGASSGLRSRIGVLPQETALYEEVSALQNLRFAASLYGVRNADARISEMLRLVGLQDRAKDVVRGFSGGMKRRLAIARALLHDPELLIFDEPTVGVDLEARHEIWSHIRSLRAEGRTVLLTTNYLDEAEALCDHIAILRRGKVLAADTPRALASRTGRCLEFECDAADAQALDCVLATHPDVLRTETAVFGLKIFLGPEANPEELVGRARRRARSLAGFRLRSPDLVEVYKALSLEAES